MLGDNRCPVKEVLWCDVGIMVYARRPCSRNGRMRPVGGYRRSHLRDASMRTGSIGRSGQIGLRVRDAILFHLRGSAFVVQNQISSRCRCLALLTFFLGPWLAVLTLLRLLMTSVLRLIGRGRPCSLRKSPQALQRTEPASSRRHNGVVDVWQFWHTGCEKGKLWSVPVNEAAMARSLAQVEGGQKVGKIQLSIAKGRVR